MNQRLAVLALIVLTTSALAGESANPDAGKPKVERPILEELLRQAYVKRRLLDKELNQLPMNTEKQVL